MSVQVATKPPGTRVRLGFLALVSLLGVGMMIRTHQLRPPSADTYASALPSDDDITLLSFAELKSAPYARGIIPAEFAALDGKRVGIVGYLLPFDAGDDVRHFLLMENTFGCCYGQPPLAWHLIEVTLDPDLPTLKYGLDPIKVEGRFQAKEQFEGGELISVYQLAATRAEFLRLDDL